MSGKVTVVVFAHDHTERLSESLDSVFQQTHPDLEIIIVGHAPTDDRLRDALEQHKGRLVYCETESTNRGVMMNTALQIATGEFVTGLNSGDTLLPEKIELQVEEFGRYPNAGLVITSCQLVDEDDNIRNIMNVPSPSQKPFILLLLYGYIFDSSKVMVRRECYSHVGPYKESLATEHEMLIRLAKHYEVAILDLPLVRQRLYPVDRDLNERVTHDTQRIISEAIASTPLDAIFPCLRSDTGDPIITSSAYAAVGAVFMAYELYEDARDNFSIAHQLCPDTSLHKMWLGVLSRRAQDYQAALDYFAGVPAGDRFYLDARLAATLTQRVQKAFPKISRDILSELANEQNTLLRVTLDFADGKLHSATQLLSDTVEELQSYLGWDTSQVLGALFKGRELMKDEWNRSSPRTRDEVVDFYKETENYLFDLTWWHKDFGRKQLTAAAIDTCRRNALQKILDFGCGTGQDGILFDEAGFDVTLADLPGNMFDYAKWRVARRGLDIDFVNSDELMEKYDAILCFDVLEHVWEPREMVEYLREHLSNGGVLLVTIHFGHSAEHPMHLERNDRYQGVDFFEMMSEAGFRVDPWTRMPFVFHRSIPSSPKQ